MILFHTLTADNSVLAIHQSEPEARGFVAGWRDLSGANRTPARIVTAERANYDAATRRLINSPIYARSDRFKVKAIIQEFAL